MSEIDPGHDDAVALVRRLYAARQRGDREALTALCHPAFAFTFNADPSGIGEGRTLIGLAALAGHFSDIDRHWEVLESSVLLLRPDGLGQVTVRLRFKLRHRASDDILEGLKTHTWTIRDGLATRLQEVLVASDVQTVQRLAGAGRIVDHTNETGGEIPLCHTTLKDD
jgi:ketosteroid isomerase-like protein